VALLALAAAPSLGAQTPHSAPQAHVTLQIDSSTVAEFDAHGLDVDVARAPSGDTGDGTGTMGSSTAEIRIVKQAGPFTGTLVGLGSSGSHLPSGVVQLFDSVGGPLLTLRLSDVGIVSDHISLSTARNALIQQSISQQEALAQLTTDSREADRDLTTAEQLGKSHVTTRQDLARAQERAQELQQRLKLAQQRQALLARQLAGQSELDEVVVLRFGHMTVDAPGAGGHGEWDRPSRLRHASPKSY